MWTPALPASSFLFWLESDSAQGYVRNTLGSVDMPQKFCHFFIYLWFMPVFYDSIGWIASYLQFYLMLRRKRAGYVLMEVKHLKLPSHNSNSTFSHSSTSQEAQHASHFYSAGHMSNIRSTLPKTNNRLVWKICLCLLTTWIAYFAFLFGTVESDKIWYYNETKAFLWVL